MKLIFAEYEETAWKVIFCVVYILGIHVDWKGVEQLGYIMIRKLLST